MFNFYSYKCGSTNLVDIKIAFKNILNFRNYYNEKNINVYNEKFRKLCGFDYSYSFSSGRMAFYSLLKSLNINKNDEVIIPAYTCVVVANAIKYVGAKPVYVDIDLNNFGIDIKKLQKQITSKTKIICVQHIELFPC